ncbi:MAG: ROK family protein [bacterium]|nr:ROK family protein [bacterium]
MYIVMDIGGTNMRVAAVAGDVLGDVKKIKTPQDPKEGVAKFVALARECAGGEKITAISGCISGSVSDAGVLSDARNLRAWEGTNIVQELMEAFGVPVHVVNDAALAGLGESYAGAGKGTTSLVYVTVSTGVGGGWIIDGKIAAAGGVAAIKINGSDLEDLVSGTAVTKKFGIHPKDLDSLGERNKLADTLAEGLLVLLGQWPSDTIVLGGSMIVGVNPIPIPRVQESLNKLLTGGKPPVIKMAELGDNGGLWGGLALLRLSSA